MDMKNIKIPKGFSEWDKSNDKREKELYRSLRDSDSESFRNSELVNNLDNMTFLRQDGAGNSLVHDKRDNKLKIYYHDWNPDKLHDLSRYNYISGDEWSEMQELKKKVEKDLPGMFKTKESKLRENTRKALPYIGATAMGALGAWAGHSELTDKIKNALKMGGTLAAIGGGTGWVISDEMKKKNNSVDMKSLNNHMKNTYGKDGYTDLNQALREIGSLEEDRYYNSKGVPKMAFDIINDSFEKIAKTKAQKMINGGRLAYDNAQKLFQKVPASNNINNRINAKAKRMLGGVVPKNMSAKSYKKVSKIDSLGSSAPINTNRLLKHQGHENSKIVRELNRQTGGNAKVSRTKNLPLDGSSSMSWETETAKPLEWGINIPKKNAKDSAISNATNREIRGLTARHEIAGEATSQSRMLKALKEKGYNASNGNVDLMRINNHQNPDVLVGDAKFVRQLSPASKKRFAEKNADNVTGISNRSYMGGRKMDESELMNTLRLPGSRISTNGSDNGKILTNYFERKIPKKAERKTMMENMAAINGFNSQEARSAVSEVAGEYQRTPFSTYKGRKKR